MDGRIDKGSFTLPGEADWEDLTVRLAEKWGADAIRDSDGTRLSDKILSLGYGIYSTICLVRADNEWAKANRDKLQQNFLMSFPVVAQGPDLTIDPLAGYFREQFTLNLEPESIRWWQVFDRTADAEVPGNSWKLLDGGKVAIRGAVPFHSYTVNFLVSRVWEEISMYNHITNGWGDREHLMAIEPRYPEAQARILQFLDEWLAARPHTSVVRFTSMFYNFCWFWGDDPGLRHIYGDWASYDFTVNPLALAEFEKKKGYRLRSEDFVNKGRYNSTHNAPTRRYRDWMDFVNEFVVDFGRKCVELVHKRGKKAYVFYDDHWIGVEPYGKRFRDFGFDGIIKCVFSGFEARKCAGVEGVETRELRLHPYLFPTGLKGEPTFKEGGNPTLDAKRFWANIRRALLRAPVDRIGLGGYLHLVDAFPDFQDYIAELAEEFRLLKSFHEKGAPWALSGAVGILTSWGSLRSWICSGHLHEHPEVELTNVLESLSGLPVNVKFLSFEDVLREGVPRDVKALLNAGREGSSWSGGDAWDDPRLIERVGAFIASGGGFIGIGEPSARRERSRFFQLADMLGVDRDDGRRTSFNRYRFEAVKNHFVVEDAPVELDLGADVSDVFALGPGLQVLRAAGGSVRLALNRFGKGRTAYLSGYRASPDNARLLYRLICHAGGMEGEYAKWSSTNKLVEAAWYPGTGKLVCINNGDGEERTTMTLGDGSRKEIRIAPHGIAVMEP